MLRPIRPEELPQILKWRNHPEVRRAMFNDHLISETEHRNWYANVNRDPSRRVLLFTYDNIAVGVSNYYQIDLNTSSCYWGFYLDPEAGESSAQRLKMWLTIQSESLAYAFHHLHCTTLRDETFAFNHQ
ncbi:MAG: UDP-4-amino-4,6-dideoxy-N-acetyl-beta-L-altrosamine N-acetyltransferase, partial [Gammaproteobacteria bacterium]|nr:UDP-4-amino-4,6-dideoxy-N-acetyl-beta-L-altrosamine N-acetyltransferase [Gammaproteobacteria bacterium]